MNAREFFTEGQRDRIVRAVKEAEHQTSGEIRVHIDLECKSEVLDTAAARFAQLKMHETKLRNGVLFYLAIADRKFAIIGDAGINQKVPEGFWDQIKELMASRFREEKFTEGLEEGIKLAGAQLKIHFPYQQDDRNELPDDISFETKDR